MNPNSFPLALPHAAGACFRVDPEAVARGVAASRESPRRRMILPIHRTGDAAVQRMLNFLQPGTYARPHRHPGAEATETITVLQGAVDFLRFDGEGAVLERHRLEPGPSGVIDMEPDVWHSFLCRAPDTIVLEIKRGPYCRETDKIFAPWAPEEGAAEAAAYLERL